MICPCCGRNTLRLSCERCFHECPCGFCVTAPGVEQQHYEELLAERERKQQSAAFMSGVKIFSAEIKRKEQSNG